MASSTTSVVVFSPSDPYPSFLNPPSSESPNVRTYSAANSSARRIIVVEGTAKEHMSESPNTEVVGGGNKFLYFFGTFLGYAVICNVDGYFYFLLFVVVVGSILVHEAQGSEPSNHHHIIIGNSDETSTLLTLKNGPTTSPVLFEWLQAFTFSEDEPLLRMDPKKELYKSLMKKSSLEEARLEARLNKTVVELQLAQFKLHGTTEISADKYDRLARQSQTIAAQQQHIEFQGRMFDVLREYYEKLGTEKAAEQQRADQLSYRVDMLTNMIQDERAILVNVQTQYQQLLQSSVANQDAHDQLVANHNLLIMAYRVQAETLSTTQGDLVKLQEEYALLQQADRSAVNSAPRDSDVPKEGQLPGPREGCPASQHGYSIDEALMDGVDDDHPHVWGPTDIENLFIHLYHPGKWAVREQNGAREEFKVFIWEESNQVWYCEDYQTILYFKKTVEDGNTTYSLCAQHGILDEHIHGDLMEELGEGFRQAGPGWHTTLSYANGALDEMVDAVHAGNFNAEGFVFVGSPSEQTESATEASEPQEQFQQGSTFEHWDPNQSAAYINDADDDVFLGNPWEAEWF